MKTPFYPGAILRCQHHHQVTNQAISCSISPFSASFGSLNSAIYAKILNTAYD